MRNLDFRRLRRRLLLGGVAPKHVRRTIKELRHHFADLEQKALAAGLSPQEAAIQAEEQLGDQDLIVQEVLAKPELKSLAHRFPWGVYGLFPIGLLVLAVGALIMLAIGLIWIGETASGLTPEAFANELAGTWWARALLEAWRLTLVYLLPVGCASWICLFAARREAAVLWPTIGVFLVLFLGFSYDVHVIHAAEPNETGQLGAGISWGLNLFLSARVLRLVIPLLIVLAPYYWWRRAQDDDALS